MRAVSPERARRYQRRTLTRPPESYVLTPAENEWHQEWQTAWMRNAEDDTPEPPVSEWYRQVQAYCRAKGLGHPSITVDGMEPSESDGTALPPNQTYTLRWTTEGDQQ